MIIVLFGNAVAAKTFLDSLETRTQLPCDIQAYQQLNRQRLSAKAVSKYLPQLFVAQKEAVYFSLGKVVTKDCVLLVIEQVTEDNNEGYICKIEGKGRDAVASEIIHIVDNFRKVFILDGRDIIVSRVDTVNYDKEHDYVSTELATEYHTLPDSYPASETKECTGLPKNIQGLREVEWTELSTQYVKENLFQVQNTVDENPYYNYDYFSYRLPNENWQMISCGFFIEMYDYLCYRKENERYPRMLGIGTIAGGSIERQFFIVGSKIYILHVFAYDNDVCQRVEIYDLRDGKMTRLYSSFRDDEGERKPVLDSSPEIISPEGCSPQKDKSPNNEQVEGVPKVTLKGINDTIVVRKSDYDEIKSYSADYGYMTNGIILSDSMVEIIRDLESPILKIEFDEGYKIAKGMPRLSSSLPCECNYSYYFDDENPNRRVRLEGVKGDEIHFGLGLPFPDPMGKVK